MQAAVSEKNTDSSSDTRACMHTRRVREELQECESVGYNESRWAVESV